MLAKSFLGAACVLTTTCLVAPAQAQTPLPVQDTSDPTAYLHDGFFLRMSLGFGPGSVKATEAISGASSPEIGFRGFTTMFELLLGGTPAPGLVIGGGLLGHVMTDPTIRVAGENYETDRTSLTMSQLALFGIWYPDPQGGFNVQALLGYGGISVTIDNRTTDSDATGAYFGLGAGYDFWIAEQWSIGPTLRVTYAALSHDQDGFAERYRFFSPILGVSGTYH